MIVRRIHSQDNPKTTFFLATEIQNIQIGDGDVARNIAVPIWMLFPRTFTCPTLLTTNFKIGTLIHINENMKNRNIIPFRIRN